MIGTRGRSAATIVLYLLSWITAACRGHPYYMLTSTRPKCVSVMGSRDETLKIEYEVPDMILAEPDSASEARALNEDNRDKPSRVDVANSGLDHQWNGLMEDKLDRMKRRKMKDMSITVVQKGGYGKAFKKARAYGGEDGLSARTSGNGRIREELTERIGKIHFSMGDMEGQVDICVQSVSASQRKPSRVSLSVTVAPMEEEEDEMQTTSSGQMLEHNKVNKELSGFERDLHLMNNRAKSLLTSADFNKQQEVSFFDQSVAMNRAATFWPIIRLIVLIVTGFTQVNHIVRYMKARRIG